MKTLIFIVLVSLLGAAIDAAPLRKEKKPKTYYYRVYPYYDGYYYIRSPYTKRHYFPYYYYNGNYYYDYDHPNGVVFPIQ